MAEINSSFKMHRNIVPNTTPSPRPHPTSFHAPVNPNVLFIKWGLRGYILFGVVDVMTNGIYTRIGKSNILPLTPDHHNATKKLIVFFTIALFTNISSLRYS